MASDVAAGQRKVVLTWLPTVRTEKPWLPNCSIAWIGDDDRGVELEIVSLDLDDAVVVIHVMPTELRRR
ncbi:hypothetical protein [Georgenia subflava]|uniref:Toxin n=1 Tax=Georgenia subflava TaxID=1622177 RepID=A0A6N7EK91_9MICO|nr:hypothetical protein [Georgenia subflava]MPV38782.1 hypothetical protein [Georgenia subflava]